MYALDTETEPLIRRTDEATLSSTSKKWLALALSVTLVVLVAGVVYMHPHHAADAAVGSTEGEIDVMPAVVATTGPPWKNVDCQPNFIYRSNLDRTCIPCPPGTSRNPFQRVCVPGTMTPFFPTPPVTTRAATTMPPKPTTMPPKPTTMPPNPTTMMPKPTTMPPKPTTMPPKPTTMPPKPTTMPPKPTTMMPKPTTMKPKPTTMPPKPTTMPPKPTTMKPKPTTMKPKPTTMKPKPTTMKPKPTTMKPKPTTMKPKRKPTTMKPKTKPPVRPKPPKRKSSSSSSGRS